MARKKSGGFNKFLNFIGLVDDAPQGYDEYDDDYASQRANGRPSTYVPQQRVSRTEDTRRRTVVPNDRYESRYNTQTRSTLSNSGSSDGYSYRQTQRAYETDPYAKAPVTPIRRTTPARTPEPVNNTLSRYSQPAAPMSRQINGTRTEMFSISSLEECNGIIKSLIEGNIVLLTLDDIDPRLKQRAVDTLSGAACALDATVRKAADMTYLITPHGMEVNEKYGVERRF